MITTRKAGIDDLAVITEIYNEAILTTVATFDVRPKSPEEQKIWFEEHGPRYPVVVAVDDGVVRGWASLSEWSGRCAYTDTAEISLYVREADRGRGLGGKLMAAIMRAGQSAGLHTVIARIAGDNQASIRLHESAGFEHIGVMREVGKKFGKLIDVHLMQLIYESG